MTDIIFSDRVIAFLDALSSALMKNKEVRQYPDVITFAFFCRKANILSLSKRYDQNKIRLGRGTIFHIAPSNVPVNFAYSLLAGLLAGNSNIVRVSSKRFRQVELIEDAIEGLQTEFTDIVERIKLVRYERGGVETGLYSSQADVRIIWGGDNTIEEIRKSPLPPRSFDITFADRYSLAVINADVFPDNSIEINKLVEGFYNDTYLFDQNACTAPHLVVWLGDKKKISTSKTVFWDALYQYEKTKYEFQPIMAVDKLTAFYRQAIEGNIETEQTYDNSLWRVDVKELTEDIEKFRCTGGYFSEYIAESLDDIVSVINDKYQTLAYYGLNAEELKDFVVKNRVNGVDRIVPVGRTLDFDLVWDGYDLIEKLSREITIQ